MLASIAHSSSRAASRSLRRSLASQFRYLSSSIPIDEGNPSSDTNSSSSSRRPHVYLNDDRKQKLISLFHQAERFVRPSEISSYIDTEFFRAVQDKKSAYNEEDRIDLIEDLRERREKSKVNIHTEGYVPLAVRRSNAAARSRVGQARDKGREMKERVEAALFGLDGSKRAGLDTIEQSRYAALERKKKSAE